MSDADIEVLNVLEAVRSGDRLAVLREVARIAEEMPEAVGLIVDEAVRRHRREAGIE